MRVVIVFSLMGLLFAGCADKKKAPQGKILPREKMEAVMWDIVSADVFTELFIKRDSTKNPSIENMQLQHKIFSIHQVSKEDYYTSYEHYLNDTEMMRLMLDSITVRAERQRNKLLEKQMKKSNP